jgi:hypothetical protein
VRGPLIMLLLLLVPQLASAQVFGGAAARARANRMINFIEAADRNRDRVTTLAEFRSAREAQARRYLNADQTVNMTMAERDPTARQRQRRQMDTNRNGLVSVSEFANFLPRTWREADGDNDNRLTAAELDLARSNLR